MNRARLAALLLAAAVALVALLLLRRAFAPVPAPVEPAVVTPAAQVDAHPGTSPSPRAALPVDAGRSPSPTAARSDGTVVLRASWGGRPGELGRRRDPESNPEMPMALAVGPGGEITIVDQVNRRVQRFAGGKLAGSFPTGGDTVQDLARSPDGRIALLDRLADGDVQLYDASGKLLDTLPLAGRGVGEGGGVTGVFADDKGVYVEREHATLVRIADAAGHGDPGREEIPGRPTRDGRLYVTAAITDRAAGEIAVRAADATRSPHVPAWSAPVHLGAPVLHLLLLDSDRHGSVYVGGTTGQESPAPPYAIVDERIAVVRIGPGGDVRGAISVPSVPTADESFRPVTVDDDGAIYVMTAAPAGVTVTRYVIP